MNNPNVHIMNASHTSACYMNWCRSVRSASLACVVSRQQSMLWVGVLLAVLTVRVHAGGHPAAAAKPEAVIPKSTFINNPEVGKDPFFPHSTRRKDAMPRLVVTAPSTNATSAPAIYVDLKLKGIAGTKEQRLALINSVTMAQGEIADIKCAGGQIVKIRCREIRDHSVLVELVAIGEVRELKLREGV